MRTSTVVYLQEGHTTIYFGNSDGKKCLTVLQDQGSFNIYFSDDKQFEKLFKEMMKEIVNE